MTTKEIAPRNTRKPQRDFLVASDREFGPATTSGTEKLYGAATQAIIALCQERDWRYKSHRAMQQVVSMLEREYGDPFIAAGFASANRFHEHFFHDSLEDYEITRRIARRYTVSINRSLGAHGRCPGEW